MRLLAALPRRIPARLATEVDPMLARRNPLINPNTLM
jgi:hypothetical protein